MFTIVIASQSHRQPLRNVTKRQSSLPSNGRDSTSRFLILISLSECVGLYQVRTVDRDVLLQEFHFRRLGRKVVCGQLPGESLPLLSSHLLVKRRLQYGSNKDTYLVLYPSAYV